MVLRFSINNHLLEAGIDEVGRGCLAGDIFAAAVILPKDFFHPLLNDSKQVKPSIREQLTPYIKQHAIAYNIAVAKIETIEKINILQATFLAMNLAIEGLKITPQFLAIDGNCFNPQKNIPYTCCKQGDTLYMHIAAASILAKTARDEYM
ncbi:MAG: ribonuclease HII, partial [Chitinophagaceae bacterium]